MILNYKDDYKDQFINLGKQYDLKFETKYLNPNNKIYLYEESNKIVGFLIIEQTLDADNIILLFVDEKQRGKKIASKLLDYFISELDLNKRILLEVSEQNYPAISLYDKFGFVTISVRKKYYSDGSNALIMERSTKNE